MSPFTGILGLHRKLSVGFGLFQGTSLVSLLQVRIRLKLFGTSFANRFVREVTASVASLVVPLDRLLSSTSTLANWQALFAVGTRERSQFQRDGSGGFEDLNFRLVTGEDASINPRMAACNMTRAPIADELASRRLYPELAKVA